MDSLDQDGLAVHAFIRLNSNLGPLSDTLCRLHVFSSCLAVLKYIVNYKLCTNSPVVFFLLHFRACSFTEITNPRLAAYVACKRCLFLHAFWNVVSLT